jgi:mannose-6-phosphate isomerase-like protein (cupin superfamily)
MRYLKKFNHVLENKSESESESENETKSEYFGNIDEDTVNNENYRKVIYTGNNMQLVLMSLKPGEEIGSEVHEDGDQFFRVESGKGTLVLDGEEFEFETDFGMTISAGKEHNIINSGDELLKVYSIYAPPEHPEGTIEKDKGDGEEIEENIDESITEEEAEQLFGEIDNEGYYDWFQNGYAEMFADKIDDDKFKEFVDNDDVQGLENYINSIFKKYDIF